MDLDWVSNLKQISATLKKKLGLGVKFEANLRYLLKTNKFFLTI